MVEDVENKSCGIYGDTCTEYGDFLSTLQIENYRGYSQRQEVRFAHPNGMVGSGLTVVCGENGSGKSTIISALMKFSNNNPTGYGPISTLARDQKDINGNTIFELTMCDSDQQKLEYTKSSKMPTNYKESSNKAYHYMFVRSDLVWKSAGIRSVEKDDYRVNKRSLISSETDMHGLDFETFQDIFENEFGNFLIAIRDDAKRWRKLKADFLSIFPDWRDIRIRNTADSGYKIIVIGRNRQEFSADYLGSGIQRVLRILAAFYGSTYHGLVIDEPELYLQPYAQKRLYELLIKFSSDRQVIIVTHSPYFIDWQAIKNGASIAHTSYDATNKQNEVSNLSVDDFSAMERLTSDWSKPHQLDVVAKELFFTRAVVFTEGQEDVALLRKFTIDNNILTRFDWFGYGSGGANNIRALLELASKLKIRAAAIYDGDQRSEYDDICRLYSNQFLIKILDEADVRDKPEKVELKDGKQKVIPVKVGYFKENGEIKRNYKARLKKLIKELDDFLIS